MEVSTVNTEQVIKPNPKWAANYKYIKKIQQTEAGKEMFRKNSKNTYDRHKNTYLQSKKERYANDQAFREKKKQQALNLYYEKKALKLYQKLWE